MVRMVDLIEKKQEHETLTTEEIKWMITGYTNGQIPEYQMSAMLMAIYFQGMTKEELRDLTVAMVKSGDEIDLSAIKGTKVDKHKRWSNLGMKLIYQRLKGLKSINIPPVELEIRQRSS